MKKACIIAILAVCGTFSVTTTASAATVNFGSCMKNVPVELKAASAPGQSGNGPLTIVTTPKGEVVGAPKGFQGWVGCATG